MNTQKFARGATIIAKYEGNKYGVRAEHDMVWIGAPSETAPKMSAEDLAELESLGWTVDEDADGWRALV